MDYQTFCNGDPHIVMCRPDFFGIEYSINPWMDTRQPANHAEAISQWNQLNAILKKLGAVIHDMEPVDGMPDLVFTANAAMIYHNKAIISRFHHKERQPEEPVCHEWFSKHGFEVVDLPKDFYFEGAGDALFCGDTLYAGYRIRSSMSGLVELSKTLGIHTLPLELVNQQFYHLDTCFCPLADRVAAYYPAAFDEYAQRVLQENIPNLIAVNDKEAQRFACNAVVLGNHVVTNSGCPNFHKDLRAAGYEPHETPLDEFIKAGGSAKCLTLRLDGENAAAWRSVTV